MSYFAPHNNSASKILFTGRTEDLEDIISLILRGNCVGLYGERRSGKTLTLEMLQAIINGDIETFKQGLVDETLLRALPSWRNRLANHISIYVSLQATRNEAELRNRFVAKLQDRGVFAPSSLIINPGSSHNDSHLDRLSDLLDLLQERFTSNGKTPVILIDEMETLGAYDKNGDAVAELFCDRNKYARVIFVHAGSYKWLERVYSPGSLFTHLEPKYLRSIDEGDVMSFLLKPLSTDDKKRFVIDMSGCKPLYAQYVGQAVLRSSRVISADDLLKNDSYTSLRQQIERNIYLEKGLDDASKRILAALAHHPNVTGRWLAKKLTVNETEIGNKLNSLEQFGTIVRTRGKCRIVGKFIETYGKAICDDPVQKRFGLAPKSWPKRLAPVAPWVAMFAMLGVAFWLYRYTHPLSDIKSFDFAGGNIKVRAPDSIETEEEGALNVSVSNTSNTNMESLILIFNSEDIEYKKEQGNFIVFSNIEPNRTSRDNINYYVLDGYKDTLISEVSISGQKPFTFDMSRRKLSIKRYGTFFSAALALLGLIIPWKKWGEVVTVFNSLILDKNTQDS